jgi:hypothetical protein
MVADRRLLRTDETASGFQSCLMTNGEAAALLRLSPRTLEKYRVIGGGPPFRKLGRRVFYTLTILRIGQGDGSAIRLPIRHGKIPHLSLSGTAPGLWQSAFHRPIGDRQGMICSRTLRGIACGCGGIGRRSGLKIRLWQQIVGSSPTTRTSTVSARPLERASRCPTLPPVAAADCARKTLSYAVQSRSRDAGICPDIPL